MTSRVLTLGLVGAALVVASQPRAVLATDRLFTYSYEPETMPEGAIEFEQWVTLRTQRTKNVGQENFNRWDIREELEYGVTDNYTVALYLNAESRSFRDSLGANQSEFSFKGFSFENKLMVLNPAENPVGLSLYLEPSFAGDEAELEQKIILGQRHGDWKWAVNLSHATEWEDNLRSSEGEFEGTIGVGRFLNSRWALGLEFRSLTKMPHYEEVETTSLFLGPVVSYRQEKWWAALTVLPQIWGRDYDNAGDGHSNLDLAHNERLHFRFILGIDL